MQDVVVSQGLEALHGMARRGVQGVQGHYAS